MGKLYLTILMLYPWLGQHGAYTDRNIGPFESEAACERAADGLIVTPRPGERQPLIAVYCSDASGSEREAYLRELRAQSATKRTPAPVAGRDSGVYPQRTRASR